MTEHAVPKGPGPFAKPSKTPDYNPDKEAHNDHTFVIQPSTRTPVQEIGGVKLNKEGRAFIKDEGLAREIQKEHRWDATVTRLTTPKHADRGHRYHFGQMPEMPWKKKVQDAESKAQNKQEDQQTG